MLQSWLENWQVQWAEHWQAWAFFAFYLVLTWLVAGFARWVTRWVVRRLLHHEGGTSVDNHLIDAGSGPVRLMALTLGFRIALQSLGEQIPGLDKHAYFDWAGKIVSALVIFAGANVTIGLLRGGLDWYVRKWAKESDGNWDKDLLPVIRRTLSLLIYFIAISIVLKHFGQDITALVTTAGVASLAVALAAQETLSNMIAGFVILVDRPFKKGDAIELSDGKSGEVMEIGLRSTRIRNWEGNAMVVPNKDMASSRVINFALPNARAAIRQTIGVDLSTDIDQAKRAILEVLQAHPQVLGDPAPAVYFTKFGDRALEIFFSCWIDSYKDKFRITDELNRAILAALRHQCVPVALFERDVYRLKEEPPQQGDAPKGVSSPGRES